VFDGADERIERFLAANPLIDKFDLLLPDLSGVLRGKRVAVADLPAVLRGEHGHDTDIYASDVTGRPAAPLPSWWVAAKLPIGLDLETLNAVPWRPDRAQVLGGLRNEDGTPFFADPRAVLDTLDQRATARGLRLAITLDVDFYLMGRGLGEDGPSPAHVESNVPDLVSHDRLAEHEEFLDLVSRWPEAMDMAPPAITPSDGPAQFRAGLGEVTGALRAADRLILMKRLVQAAARATGNRATFMAMPLSELPGSGLSIRVRVLDPRDGSVFAGTSGAAALRAALEGLRDLAPESIALLAPNANSLRRLQCLVEDSSADLDNREESLMAGLIAAAPAAEAALSYRLACADANAYLACACVEAGILHGLDSDAREPAGAADDRHATESAAEGALLTCVGALRAFRHARTLPGYLGERFCELFHACRSSEHRRFARQVTPTEWRWYLGG
jgi:glutamine synthetase